MEKFKKFEINNQQNIVGGELIKTFFPVPPFYITVSDLYDTNLSLHFTIFT